MLEILNELKGHICSPNEAEVTYAEPDADHKLDKWVAIGLGAAIGIPGIFLIGSMVISKLP